MRDYRKKLKKVVTVGKINIGGNFPITIQSMTNTDTKDVSGTVNQIKKLEEVGCEIVRVSVPDNESAKAIKAIKERVNIPIVADIHFDYKIAIESIKNGADKIRINPGNIGSAEKVLEVVKVAKEYGVPIRVGANSGSINKKYEHLPKIDALVESALEEVRILESAGFYDIVISLKSSDILETVQANRKIHALVDYPVHIGVTEAGTLYNSLIKSSAALGTLLLEGIGDTIRISIAGDPVNEVITAKKLLTFLKMRKGVDVVACPTCARSNFDVEQVALEVEKFLSNIEEDITVSVLGCVVNGVGEAKDSDVGIAGVKDGIAVFYKGEIIGNYQKEKAFEILKEKIDVIVKERRGDT